MGFKVIAYEKGNGEIPVEIFLKSLDVKMRAKVFGMIGILKEKGNQLREPYSKLLDDGEIILTNGFVKKTNKTPREEIKLAKDRRKDYIERIIGK